MNNFKNKPIWFWGFIILILINISAISSLFYVSHKIHNSDNFQGFHRRIIKKKVNSDTKNPRERDFQQTSQQIDENPKTSKTPKPPKPNKQVRLWEDMNLSPEQRKFMHINKKEHIAKMRELKMELNKQQAILFDEISKQTMDKTLVNQYKKELLLRHGAIVEETIRYYEILKTKLNEEQMKQIKLHISKQLKPPHKRPPRQHPSRSPQRPAINQR